MAKSKKERRSSIRHMAADDAFSVLEALERAEQERPTDDDPASGDDAADDDDALEHPPQPS